MNTTDAVSVTVIIPTYNAAGVLGRAIKSVLDQTYDDLELIVVDDRSTDNTAEVVESFNDPRVRYVGREKNGGEAAARNTGIRLAKGKYVAFLDSDDEWLPTKLEKQMDVFQRSSEETGLVYAGCVWIDEAGRFIKRDVPRLRGNVFESLLTSNQISGSSSGVLLRRKCLKHIGLFDDSLPGCPDWDMWIRLSKHCRFDFVSEDLVIYHASETSIASKIDKVARAREAIHDKMTDQLLSRRRTHSLFHFKSGNLYCHKGKMAHGRRELLKAILIWPFNVRYLVHLSASLLGFEGYRALARLKRASLSVGRSSPADPRDHE